MNELRLLYVLSLEEGNFYVGVTDNLNRRLAEHKGLLSGGAGWVKMHKYVSISECKELTSALEEDMKVKELMLVHGIDKVRGGSYSNPVLSSEQVTALNRELFHADNKCLKCGSSDHYVNSCVVTCTRCKREGHDETKCYAVYNADKKKLCKGTTKAGAKCKYIIEEKYEYCLHHKK